MQSPSADDFRNEQDLIADDIAAERAYYEAEAQAELEAELNG